MQARTISVILLVATIGAGFVSGAIGGLYIVSLQEQKPRVIEREIPISREPVADLVERVMPSVVSIDIISKRIEDPFEGEEDQDRRKQIGGGSGFFVTTDGMIVTNRHVLDDADVDYEVMTNDGRRYSAKVLAIDTVLDLAILKIDGNNFPALSLGDSSAVRPGQTVIAIGNTLAAFQNSVTMGIVSGINRKLWTGDDETSIEMLEEAIQTDAAINYGNSGGPLIDLSGEVIGVNTAVGDAQSLGFALPANAVRRAVDSVREFGRIVRPWIGIRYQMEEGGARISELGLAESSILPGSPAEKAGLRAGDLITSFSGQKLGEEQSLAGLMADVNPGDTVKLEIMRNEEILTIDITLGDQKRSE